MKTQDLIQYLETNYPSDVAEEWDNVGLLAGDDRGETRHVFLALDLTEDTLGQAIDAGADFILTHHPMIFRGLKQINNHSVTGRRLISLLEHHMCCYAMHTNYDILGMAEHSADLLKLVEAGPIEALSPERPHEGLGRVGDLEAPCCLKDLALKVKEAFCLPEIRVYGDPERVVKRAAVCTGSGKSLISQVLSSGAQVYVTGDIDHHTALDSMAEGLAILDAGHYGTEYIFMDAMKKRLAMEFPSLTISTAKVCFPYRVY